MPHASDAQRLQALHAQLTAALASGDWRAVGEVDGAIRQCLEQLPRDPAADPAVQAARAQAEATSRNRARGRIMEPPER